MAPTPCCFSWGRRQNTDLPAETVSQPVEDLRCRKKKKPLMSLSGPSQGVTQTLRPTGRQRSSAIKAPPVVPTAAAAGTEAVKHDVLPGPTGRLTDSLQQSLLKLKDRRDGGKKKHPQPRRAVRAGASIPSRGSLATWQ